MRILLLVLFFYSHFILYAQKNDYNWILGSSTDKPTIGFGLFNFNFNENTLKLFQLTEADSSSIFMANNDNTTFSDKDGTIKFFTNGLNVYDSSFKIMQNGDTINPGYNWNFSFTKKAGYRSSHGIYALPDPKNPEKYTYIIHQAVDTSSTWYINLLYSPLYYSKVDMEGNNGLGKVIEKNIVIDTGHFEPPAIVRHGNGRDWWIIMPEMYFNKYHRLLVTPFGIQGPWEQEIGPGPTINGGAIVLNEFSNSGEKYVRGWSQEGVVVFNFDRCSGMLYNPDFIPIPDSNIIGKPIFSPSGQFLYLMGGGGTGQLFQINLNDTNKTFKEIANSNNLSCKGGKSYFTYMTNAPDGRIYLTTGGVANKCLSVINEPDKPYPDCDFEHPYLELPYYNVSFPYFPNYRLGPLTGSACDTITSTLDIINPNPIAITYPNPTLDKITIELMKSLQHSSNLEVSLVDISGKLLYSGKLPPYSYIHQIDVKDLVPGMYCVLIRDRFKLLGSVKVIKL